MKKSSLFIIFLACLIAACDNVETKTHPSLTCKSTNNSMSKEERQEIADLCFKQGHYSKSSGMKW